MRVKTLGLFWVVQRGRPPAPALQWPTPSAPPDRRSGWAAASTSPAWTVSSWTELSRSAVVRTAGGRLRPPGACPHPFRPKSPTKSVSVFSSVFGWWFYFLVHLNFPVWSAGRCRVPMAIRNSNLADRYITMKSFASGDRVQYVCDVGYISAGGSRYRKCVDGKWTPLHLRCERRDLFFRNLPDNQLFNLIVWTWTWLLSAFIFLQGSLMLVGGWDERINLTIILPWTDWF